MCVEGDLRVGYDGCLVLLTKPMCVEGDLREHGSEVLAASRYREHILHRAHMYRGHIFREHSCISSNRRYREHILHREHIY